MSQGRFKAMIRILLAEDDAVLRRHLAHALESAGYSVTAVSRGTEALPLLKSEFFDVLLTDVVMPEMDGIELAHHCAGVRPRIRIMFITGFAAVEVQCQAPHAAVLSKPFHLRDLVRQVDRALSQPALASGA